MAPDGLEGTELTSRFRHTATEFGMTFEFDDDEPARVIVMVSRLGHCLNDLIFRWRAGTLGGSVVVAPAGDGTGTTVIATYAVATPDGDAWARSDRGTYTIVANPNEVRDATGYPVEPAELAEFNLNVAKAPKAPRTPAVETDKAPTVRKLRFAGRGENASVTAWFSEDVSASIDAGDLYVIAEDGVTRAVDPSRVT